MNKKLLPLSMMMCVAAAPLWAAQEAPAPRRAPHTPVQRQIISERKTEAPPRQIQGTATIIDNERLRISGYDVRLFGVVPPQISASFGVQARAALDSATNGQNLNCAIVDRARDGRLLAQCRNGKNVDLALDLLRRGLAVAARGSLGESSLAVPYLEAEQSAQSQRLGLWSLTVPSAAEIQAKPKADVEKSAAVSSMPPVPETKPEIKPEVKSESKEEAKAVSKNEVKAEAQAPVSAITSQQELAKQAAQEVSAVTDVGNGKTGFLDWVQRLQLLLATFVIALTAFGVVGLQMWQKRRDRTHERKALAAALRGELMASRAIAHGRLHEIKCVEDDVAMSWPRLRATLYQASVARIGILGAELARQISSIYGQAGDYAAFYNSIDADRAAATPKAKALQTLIKHIDVVLPRLASIEMGTPSAPVTLSPVLKQLGGITRQSLSVVHKRKLESVAVTQPLPVSAPVAKIAAPVEEPVKAIEQMAVKSDAPAETPAASLSQEQVVQQPQASIADKVGEEKIDTVAEIVAEEAAVSVVLPELTPAAVAKPDAEIVKPIKFVAPAIEAKKEETIRQPEVAKPAEEKSELGGKMRSIAPLWVAVREFAQERFTSSSNTDDAEDPVIDYAKMIEEEMATLGVYDLGYDEAEDDDLHKLQAKRNRG